MRETGNSKGKRSRNANGKPPSESVGGDRRKSRYGKEKRLTESARGGRRKSRNAKGKPLSESVGGDRRNRIVGATWRPVT